MKPVINLNELEDFEESSHGDFQDRYARISELVGASKLGYSIAIVPPGKKACPLHNHRINEEMFLILEGTGTLRFGKDEYPLRPFDVIACPPGGRDVAHQIINTGTTDLRYFCLSTNEPQDICEYPDSDKMLAWDRADGDKVFRHISRTTEHMDYFDGEK